MPKTKTYFGIAVPPFKREKNKSGGLTLRFVIQADTIPSKKNGKYGKTYRGRAVNFVNKCFNEQGSMTKEQVIKALDMVYSALNPNLEWKVFLENQKPKLIAQMAFYSQRFQDRGLIFPISRCGCNIKLYFSDQYASDNGNKTETLHDLFVKAGVITDDNFKVFSPTNADGAYFESIPKNIAVVDLTIKEF